MPMKINTYRFPVASLDRFSWAGWGDPLRLSPAMELVWDTPPDDATVARAMELAQRRFPVMTCRLASRWGRIFWEGPYGDPLSRSLVRRELPGRPEDDLETRQAFLRDRIMQERHDPGHGHGVKLYRVALPESREWWLGLFHHMLGDGRSAFRIMDSILEFMLDPKADPAPESLPRDARAIWNEIRGDRSLHPGGFRERVADWTSYRMLRSPWRKIPIRSRRRYRKDVFGPPIVRGLRLFAKSCGAGLPDLIHAAIVRALAEVGGFACKSPKGVDWIRLGMVVDLRVLARIRLGIGNFMGVAPVAVKCPPPEDWKRLVGELTAKKESALDKSSLARALQNQLLVSRIPMQPWGALNRYLLQRPAAVSATVANVGDLSRMLPHSRALPISAACTFALVHPVVQFTLGVSLYRGQLTISSGSTGGEAAFARQQEAVDRIRAGIERLSRMGEVQGGSLSEDSFLAPSS